MINVIKINSETSYYNENNTPLYALYDLSKINIFVGANNSGKSRFIRSLLISQNNLLLTDSVVNNDEKIRNLRNIFNQLIVSINKNNAQSTAANININTDELMELFSNSEFCTVYKLLSKEINNWYSHNHINSETIERKYAAFSSLLDSYAFRIQHNRDAYGGTTCFGKNYKNKCFYIPILRGIENFSSYYNRKPINNIEEARLSRKEWNYIDEYADNSKHIYENKVHSAYNIETDLIFTAENLYDDIKNKLLGNEAQRRQIYEFQEYISKNFYDGKGFLITPTTKKETGEEYLAVKIAGNEEHELYNLGDGIKQIITILYKIFECQNKEAYFFIEEPEINLHPGYQRKLMQLLQDKLFDKHQFFIVTHSNHILESILNTSETSVYAFIDEDNKYDHFRIVNTTNKDLGTLNLLGVDNYSVLMSNCMIFIEGLSDKIYIQRYLEIYFKERKRSYIEDIHYAFVETGGGNIAHWNFLQDIDEDQVSAIHASSFSNRSFIICDSDGKTKRDRKQILKSMVGENNFYELPVREIENTIKRNVLEKVLFGKEKPKILRNYDENKSHGYYTSNAKIGHFIDSHYNTGRKYETKSGTITNKIEFAKKAIQYINTIDDLTEHAKELCERITAFIDRSNKN